MNKRCATLLTLAAALIAVSIPIVLALYLADRQARDSASQLALAYARDVVHRSDATADQAWTAVQQLQKMARQSAPCSPASLELMKRIDIESSFIQAIGHVSGTHMDCASVDPHGDGLELGPVQTTQPTGVRLRYNVEFPFARGTRFLVIEYYGYAVIVHKTLPIDVTLPTKDLSLATYTSSGYILTSRGFVDPRWLEMMSHDGREETFIDGGYIVAVVASKRHFIGGIAALPISRIGAGMRSAAVMLVPAGIGAGIMLALAVLYLAKLQLAMPAVIKAALRRSEFFVVYQPIVDLQTGHWVGAEALIRWRRPNGELVRPDLFIPIAEEAGLIQRVTQRVVQCVTRDAIELFNRNPELRISINVSAADLHSDDTVQLFQRLLRDTGARRGRIVVEVTERGLSKPQAASTVISALRNSGVCFAVDDFGTGYSSLSYLENFELDYLKIDKSFVDTVGTQAPTSQVVMHVIEMAKALKLEMIAEGVETQAQAEFLRGRGVRYAQGFLFSKPLPFADLLRQVPRMPDAVGQSVPDAAIWES
ncbi:MAG TPA: EAL domain-containing protein [Steroidobacteraceae bacterium]|jgi:sensor c-di-GMP phosphodiesterase-like protein|nr:EAL domain-containing protein [Steroidobacteraceae bacterium]